MTARTVFFYIQKLNTPINMFRDGDHRRRMSISQNHAVICCSNLADARTDANTT
jgi:hypothetical protein